MRSNTQKWYHSHCGSPVFARYIYKIVGGVLYQQSTAPCAQWVRIPDAQLDIGANCVAVTYPARDGAGPIHLLLSPC